MRLVRVAVAAILLSLAAAPEVQAARGDVSVEEQYDLGLRYLKRGYYVKALEQFNKIRNYHRDDPYAVKAELAIADVYFEQAEWDQARVAYEEFMRLHPRHEDIDYVVYRLGLTSLKKSTKVAARDQTWTRHAVTTWAGYESRFASSEHLEEVQELLTEAKDRLAHKEFLIGEFYFRRKAYNAVISRMEGMLRTYPDCSDVPMALAMLAVSYKRLGDETTAAMAAARLTADHPDSRAVRWLRFKEPSLLAAPAAEEAAAP
ncbi:MAG: hypothetical protein RIT28_982 [Pseudomonadota bacterium]